MNHSAIYAIKIGDYSCIMVAKNVREVMDYLIKSSLIRGERCDSGDVIIAPLGMATDNFSMELSSIEARLQITKEAKE
jgi:hypothetical protein